MATDTVSVFVSINGVDLSNKCVSAPGVEQAKEEVDITCFGDTIRKMQGTLEQAPELAFTFLQDFAAGQVHDTIQARYSDKAEIPIRIRPTNGAISVTNPEFQFNARVIKYSPLDASQPGGVHKATAVLRRTTAITVDTTP